MFRATLLSILRSIRLYATACGMLYPIRCRYRLAVYWVQRTTSCSVQSNTPEDGQKCCPKYVELIWIYQQTVSVASSWLSSLPQCICMFKTTMFHKLFPSSVEQDSKKENKLWFEVWSRVVFIVCGHRISLTCVLIVTN